MTKLEIILAATYAVRGTDVTRNDHRVKTDDEYGRYYFGAPWCEPFRYDEGIRPLVCGWRDRLGLNIWVDHNERRNGQDE